MNGLCWYSCVRVILFFVSKSTAPAFCFGLCLLKTILFAVPGSYPLSISSATCFGNVNIVVLDSPATDLPIITKKANAISLSFYHSNSPSIPTHKSAKGKIPLAFIALVRALSSVYYSLVDQKHQASQSRIQHLRLRRK